MASLLEDLDVASGWISQALQSSGYAADFTPPSLWEIDRFFDEQVSNGKPRRGGLLSADLGSRIFALGAYTGEVISATSVAPGSRTRPIRRARAASSWCCHPASQSSGRCSG